MFTAYLLTKLQSILLLSLKDDR